jgi:hypothetical protein
MEYFLERIAKSLYSEFGNKLNSQCLVFPNRRAGLFFLKYLAAELKQPVWTPAIMSISDLFRKFSKLHPAENEILLYELYKVYRNIGKTPEPFDEFYFWGDMLLNDFDDADKYLTDAAQLFSNVQDLKKIDQQFGGISPEQAEIIKRFWTNFNPEKLTDEKLKFISLWSILTDLYYEFRSVLKEKNIAYEGMIFREVTENKGWEKISDSGWSMVHFIGFNALNECEKAMMSGLKNEGSARFYWDYDNSYITEEKLNSAGFFLRDNIRLFGNDMPSDWSYDTYLSKNSEYAKRRVIDTSSDIAQAKLIPYLIRELPSFDPDNAHHTAIVLADENLLIPVLTSLPEEIPDVNITMGYPLGQTYVYSLIRYLLDLQQNLREKDGKILFSHKDVLRVLKINLIAGITGETDREIIKEIVKGNLLWIPSERFEGSPVLSKIFSRPAAPELIPEYLKAVLLLIVSGSAGSDIQNFTDIMPETIRNEFIYRAILSVNRLESIFSNSGVILSLKTWSKLLDRLLKRESVPFSGEPLSGIQIMGILESRVLDFKNLIILSVNEGILPSFTTSSSFIPFALREAFRLPSVNHQESVYAYHFYRLLHRAENVTFIYNSNPEGLRSGEISRFLQQMKYEPGQKPEFMNLSFEIRNPGFVRPVVERTNEHNTRLLSRFSTDNRRGRLSPMAINTWLNCRMKFYYRYVNDLKEPEVIAEEIDPAMLGIMLHEAIRSLYSRYSGIIMEGTAIDGLLNDERLLYKLITNVINEKFKRGNDSYFVANEQIVTNVLKVYINRILEIDKKLTPFIIMAVEKPVSFRIEYEVNGTSDNIVIGGTIDRVDIKDGVTRIVDYKTGVTVDSIGSVGELFRDDRKKDADGWLQTMLYCEGYLREKPETVVMPVVYKIKKTPGDQMTGLLKIGASRKETMVLNDFRMVRDEFMDGLKNIIGKIFSETEPFIMTNDAWNKCSVCPYRILCMR